MSWIDGSTLFLLLAQFGGIIKLLYLAGQQGERIHDLRRRVGDLEAYHVR